MGSCLAVCELLPAAGSEPHHGSRVFQENRADFVSSMLPPPFQNALVLTGPTGSGKTQLGIELAQRLDAEIISMDSMALYRRLDIGTAKPTPAQRALAPHHLVDVLEPWESASVAWWLEQA